MPLRRHRFAGCLVAWSIGLIAASLSPAVSASPASNSSGFQATTIGLVITDWRFALFETADKSECPAGLQPGEVAHFRARPDHLQQLQAFGGIQNRGSMGENANHTPLAVEDTLPFRELKTLVGHGFNLDDTPDGRATQKTCKHEKFTSPAGVRVDNQMARVLGCVQGWRTTGFMAEFYSDEVETSPLNRHLIEITGVDNELNDASVEVTIYKGRDRLVRSGAGAFIPFISHRVDARFPDYTFKTRGKILDGVLTTEPISLARFPLYIVQITGERQIRDMRLRLQLTPNGAEGHVGGYESIDTWWAMHSKGPGVGSDVGAFSPAGLYRAARRYADGYPDPTSGECTAISVTYKVSAVRALIVHGDERGGRAIARRTAAQSKTTHGGAR